MTSLPNLIIAAGDTSSAYGSPNPQFKGIVEGLVNDDPVEITYSTTAVIGSGIGEYDIVPEPDPVTASNYAVINRKGTLTITKAPLKITAQDTSRMYGRANPQFRGIVEWIKNDDDVFIYYSTNANINSHIGDYEITPGVDERFTGNYEVTFETGTLTITKAPLKVTALDTSRTFGEPNPVFKGVVEGRQTGDNVVVAYSTSASPDSPPGAYPIIPSVSVEGDDYELEVINGVLTVTPVVGLESPHAVSDLIPFPNPSKGTFIVDYTGSLEVNYQIMEFTGRKISEGILSPGRNEVRIEGENGLYIFKLNDGRVRKMEKRQ
jgi:hypothetical protein